MATDTDFVSREMILRALRHTCKILLTVRGGKTAAAIIERYAIRKIENRIDVPAANVVEIPVTGIGDLSDGYHTFNGLYRQRLVLFAALVKTYRDRAWKSLRHEDGELCFGGGWFIVGIDTPEGSYTYHYETGDWYMFDCEELPVGKHWDGHTEEDVTRLLTLPATLHVEKEDEG